MSETDETPRRPKATRIDEGSFAFNRALPVVLIVLAVLTVGLIVASILVIAGVF